MQSLHPSASTIELNGLSQIMMVDAGAGFSCWELFAVQFFLTMVLFDGWTALAVYAAVMVLLLRQKVLVCCNLLSAIEKTKVFVDWKS